VDPDGDTSAKPDIGALQLLPVLAIHPVRRHGGVEGPHREGMDGNQLESSAALPGSFMC
jgi:hypothetical protein